MSKIMTTHTMSYISRLNKDTGEIKYRKSDYRNKENWITPSAIDVDLIKQLTESKCESERYSSELEGEVETLRNIPEFISMWKEMKAKLDKGVVALDTYMWIYDSHIDSWYYTLKEREDTYCEQCGDSDGLEWDGTVEELKQIVERYLV